MKYIVKRKPKPHIAHVRPLPHPEGMPKGETNWFGLALEYRTWCEGCDWSVKEASRRAAKKRAEEHTREHHPEEGKQEDAAPDSSEATSQGRRGEWSGPVDHTKPAYRQ